MGSKDWSKEGVFLPPLWKFYQGIKTVELTNLVIWKKKNVLHVCIIVTRKMPTEMETKIY